MLTVSNGEVHKTRLPTMVAVKPGMNKLLGEFSLIREMRSFKTLPSFPTFPELPITYSSISVLQNGNFWTQLHTNHLKHQLKKKYSYSHITHD
jgi:hypothetical protein